MAESKDATATDYKNNCANFFGYVHDRKDDRRLGMMDGKVVFKVTKSYLANKSIVQETVWESWTLHKVEIESIIIEGMRDCNFKTPNVLSRSMVEDIITPIAADNVLNPIKAKLNEIYEWYWNEIDKGNRDVSRLLIIDPTDHSGMHYPSTLADRIGLHAPHLANDVELHTRYINAALILPILSIIERAESEMTIQENLIILAPNGGEGKSSLCKAIAQAIGGEPRGVDPKFYSEIAVKKIANDTQLRDSIYGKMVGKAIVEMSECEGLTADEDNDALMKNLVNTSGKDYRDAYGREVVHHPFTHALIGTSNQMQILASANVRRWVVVEKEDVKDNDDSVWNDDKTIWLDRHPDIVKMLIGEILSLHRDNGVTVEDIMQDEDILKARLEVAKDYLFVEDMKSAYINGIVSEVEKSELPHNAVITSDFNRRFKADFPDFKASSSSFQQAVMKHLATYGIEKKYQKIKVGDGLDSTPQSIAVFRKVVA